MTQGPVTKSLDRQLHSISWLLDRKLCLPEGFWLIILSLIFPDSCVTGKSLLTLLPAAFSGGKMPATRLDNECPDHSTMRTLDRHFIAPLIEGAKKCLTDLINNVPLFEGHLDSSPH